MKLIDLKKISEFDFEVINDAEFNNLDCIDLTDRPKTFTYVLNKSYLNKALANENITAIITTKEISKEINKKIGLLIDNDPFFTFYKITNCWDKLNPEFKKTNSIIDPTSLISNSASIDQFNVFIGKNVIIEENVVIKSNVTIKDNSIIRANSVIGSEGFEVKKIGPDNSSVVIKHQGGVEIGHNVEIQANCCIDKGLFLKNTQIKDNSKIDNLCHIAHGAIIGKNCLIAAKAMIAGSVLIGDNCWVGPGSNISNGVKIGNNARITIGSTVIKDVPENKTYTGYFAQEHKNFLKKYLNFWK